MAAPMMIVLIVVLGGLNFLIRFLPAVLVNRFALPKTVEVWLGFVPVATMAAIVVPTLLAGPDKTIFISGQNLNLLSALPTILVAWKTKSLALTLTAGIITMAMLQMFWM